jgi:DnaJ like chaperone protein
MEFKGKLFGALLGSLAGPMGTVLGGLIGHLYDRAAEERKARLGGGAGDAIPAAQLDFLSSLIGLSVLVASADGRVRVSEIEALRSFFRHTFSFSEGDQRLLQRMIDETFLRREELDLVTLCRYYRGCSSPSGRLLLLRLLFKIAAADRAGVDEGELRLIRRIAAELGIDAATLLSLEMELAGGQQAYAVLGLSPGASDEAVRSAYRRLAAQYHPDTVSSLGEEFVQVAEEKFKALGQAYSQVAKERGWDGPGD